MTSYLKAIKDVYADLSPSEKIFAYFAIERADELIQMSIHEVSKLLGVSVATIIGMIKKIGLEGYADLKIKLAQESNNPMRQKSWDTLITTTSLLQNTYTQVAQANIKALTESINIVSFHDMVRAAGLIAVASRVCFFGTGSSSLLAAEAHDMLFRLGLNCCYNQERDHQLILASCMHEGEVAVVVTQTGVNMDNLRITQLLIDRKVNIIGISNYSGTPFSKMVNVILSPLGSSDYDFGSHFTFRVPIFCIIEALYYTLIELIGEEALQTAKIAREIAANSSL